MAGSKTAVVRQLITSNRGSTLYVTFSKALQLAEESWMSQAATSGRVVVSTLDALAWRYTHHHHGGKVARVLRLNPEDVAFESTAFALAVSDTLHTFALSSDTCLSAKHVNRARLPMCSDGSISSSLSVVAAAACVFVQMCDTPSRIMPTCERGGAVRYGCLG